MAKKVIYQTLEDRANPDKIEKDGPFPCNWDNTWLGDGYYFWDTFIENAHWWGAEVRNYKNGYIVCKAFCDFNDGDCFDLVGNTEHLILFTNTYNFLKSKGLANENAKVKRIIEYLKTNTKGFNYQAVRAYGLKSKNIHSVFNLGLYFEDNKPQYLDLKPAIQICFYKKDSLNLRNYQIVYPDEYIEGYVI